MANVTQIADIAACLQYIGKTVALGDADYELARALHPLVESAVRRFVGTGIVQTTYTHFLPPADAYYYHSDAGPGSHILRLPEWPLRSITSIHEDTAAKFGQASGAFGSSSELTAGTDFFIPYNQSGIQPMGHVVREGIWPREPGSVKIVYSAGWSKAELEGTITDPTLDASSIRLAVLKAFAENFGEAKRRKGGAVGVKSESLDGWSITYDTESSGGTINLPDEVKMLLQPFRRFCAV